MSKTITHVKISLTQFLNFSTKPPEQQLTVVRAIRKQHEVGYRVPPDCYKQFREAVIRMHQTGKSKDYLDQLAGQQTEPTRAKHYPGLVAGYKKFMGRKTLDWFERPTGVWVCEDLKINIRPELALVIDGTPTAIKMWLNNDDSLNKRRAEMITHMMTTAIPSANDELTTAVLDVRKGKLYRQGKSDKEQTALLRSQAKCFLSLYREL
ncbi:hypothetical protein [Gimesia sp.]|uniref:hypothetical protein n=1 Tax=Gimesia sp. TaxID=2024833 RepID=UPI003A8EDA10